MNESYVVQKTEQVSILKNLLQSYEAEFSGITKKLPDQDGLFPLDVDINETDNFLLMKEKVPVGFCVKGTVDERHDIFEFYVLPVIRNEGVGEWFAHQIFSSYQGPWQVRQIDGADKARDFWRKAIGSFSNGRFDEESLNDPYWGDVTRQTFENSL